MNEIGKPEREAQRRVITLLRDKSGYRLRGDWDGHDAEDLIGKYDEGFSHKRLRNFRSTAKTFREKILPAQWRELFRRETSQKPAEKTTRKSRGKSWKNVAKSCKENDVFVLTEKDA